MIPNRILKNCKKMRNIIYLLFISALVLSSCRKDIELESTDITILIGEDVETNLHGRVVTEGGRSIPEAEVKIGNTTVFTNSDGYYNIPNLTVPEDGFAMEINSPLYSKSIRRIIPQAQTNTYEEVTLKRQRSGTFYESSALNFLQDTLGSASVTLAPNCLVDRNNNAYNGSYTANIVYYNPTEVTTLKTMPGNLDGINKEGKKVTLGSLGMIYIDVRSENGESLFLADGKTARVSIMTFGVGNNPPIEVPIWRLDNTSGIWVEEGVTNSFDTNPDAVFYGFDISEFNFWNCDIAVENTCLSGTILDESDVPVENRLVVITFTEDGINYYSNGGNTNSKGEYRAKVPKDKVITLSVYDINCNDALFTQEVGPFTNDIEKFDLTPNIDKDYYTINGLIYGCEDIPLGNATVFLYDEQDKVRASTQTKTDGRFTIHNVCFRDEGFRIKVLDLNTNLSILSDNYGFTASDIDIGEILICQVDNPYFINVSSTLGSISFNNPALLVTEDSLVLSAETNLGDFLLIGSVSATGDNFIDLIEIRIGNDQLTCTSKFEYALCMEMNITELNADLQIVAGSIDGVLYSGDISNEESIIGNDVSIIFRAQY